MEKRDFEAERNDLNDKVSKCDLEIENLSEKIKKVKARRRSLNYKLAAITRDEQKYNKEQKSLAARHAAGKLSLEDYANKNGMVVIDAGSPKDLFCEALSSKYKVRFYSPYSFYNLLSWLDEGCEITQDKRKYLINQAAVVNVVKRLARLKPDEINELEKARMPKKGETSPAWKQRFFAFLMKPPYMDLLSPKRKVEMEIWLRIDAIERPL
ncbi:MAG TPA: hypothetical protein VK308_15860 [Pyrinomonadaceae bacterium]|nr:hypothetical protein [Pyrinomonadaceae bacterium]